MTGAAEAGEAIVALAFGGLFFIIIGGSLASSMEITPLFDFRLWGTIYLVAAVVLGVVTVYGFVRSIAA